MSRRRLRAGLTLTGIVVTAAVSTAVVAGVVLTATAEPAPAESHNAAATSTLPRIEGEAVPVPEDPPPPPVVGMRGAAEKSTAGIGLTVGDCVALDESGIGRTTCGSATSRYKIIATAPTTDRCPTDADRTYAETLRGALGAALCLDIDWITGSCVDLTPDNPRRLDSTVPTAVRVLNIRQNTADPNSCAQGDHGIVYRERNFVVCVASL